jgi:hypothetical protein
MPHEFSDELRQELRKFFPEHDPPKDAVEKDYADKMKELWGEPADNFVNEILAEARWAVSELFHLQRESRKGEMRAECANLLSSLKALKRDWSKFEAVEHKLRNISFDFDRLLPFEADPLNLLDHIGNDPQVVDEMISHIKATIPLIEKLPKSQRPDEKQHSIAVEMAVLVLRILKNYCIAPSEYASADHEDYESDAVKILRLLGNDIGLRFAPTTWRDIIGEAKKVAPDLYSAQSKNGGVRLLFFSGCTL